MLILRLNSLCLMQLLIITFSITFTFEIEIKGPCRERNRFMSMDKVNEFEMLDVNIGKTAVMECRYCDEDTTNEPRIWFKTKHINRTAIRAEVEVGLQANLTSNRIYMTLDHCLFVQKVTKDDAGLYFCEGLEGEDTDFQYSVDVVPEHTKEEKGKLSEWSGYVNKTIVPLNHNISKSVDNEIVRLRNITGVFVKVVSEWEDWGPCDGCLETRERVAKCRIKPRLNHKVHPIDNATTSDYIHNLLSSLKLSCHSLQLQERVPNISQLVNNVPNFVITEDCVGPCKLKKPGRGVRYHNTYNLLERSFATFICPESNLSSKVVWRKNNFVMKQNRLSASKSGSSTVYVDSFNILHFEGTKLIDKGNYTCYVDGIHMQELIITVGSHPLIDSAIFGLGFVFLFFMSLFFYSAGVVIAYNRRYMFKRLKFV